MYCSFCYKDWKQTQCSSGRTLFMLRPEEPETDKQTLICKQIHRSPNLDLVYGTRQYSVQCTYIEWKWSIALLSVRNDAMFVVKGVTSPETIAIIMKNHFLVWRDNIDECWFLLCFIFHYAGLQPKDETSETTVWNLCMFFSLKSGFPGNLNFILSNCQINKYASKRLFFKAEYLI